MDKLFVKYILESKNWSMLMEAEKPSKLTLNDLYTSTDQDRKDRGKNQIDRVDVPEVHQDGKIITPSQLDPNKPATFDFKVLSGKSGKTYSAHIRFQDNLKTTSKVKMGCRCGDFQFRFGTVLYVDDALYNPTSYPNKMLTQLPEKTNPEFKTKICKHLLACCDALYNEGIIK